MALTGSPRLAFTVVLRLADGARGDPAWARWDEALAAPPRGLGADAAQTAATAQPFKRYPGGDPYFAEYVQHVLFPPHPAVGTAERRIHRPLSTRLILGRAVPGEWELDVDLVECLTVGLPPSRSYGLVHLSTSAALTTDEILACAWILQRRYNPPAHPEIHLELRRGADSFPMRAAWPLAALARHLFGSAHPEASHRAWIGAIALTPDDVNVGDEPALRRALALGNQALGYSRRAVARDPEGTRERTLFLAAQEAVIHGRGGAFTTSLPDLTSTLYNVRSYWVEAILFGIIRHDYSEGYAVALGALGGDPLSPAVDELYRDWLAFRNTLSWTHLSTTRDPPQELLARTEVALGTKRLFGEMDQNFASYVAQRDRLSNEKQDRALASLQVYGATFAAVSTVAGVLQAVGDGWIDRAGERIAAAAILLVLGVVVFAVTGRFVRRSAR